MCCTGPYDGAAYIDVSDNDDERDRGDDGHVQACAELDLMMLMMMAMMVLSNSCVELDLMMMMAMMVMVMVVMMMTVRRNLGVVEAIRFLILMYQWTMIKITSRRCYSSRSRGTSSRPT